jgi:hypothetical protein
MITSLIMLVVYLIVIGLIIWVLLYAIQQIPMSPPIANVARVVIVVVGALIVVLLLLQFLGMVGPMPRLGTP